MHQPDEARAGSNARESAVPGLVGAGGIGIALDTVMNLFQWDRVAIVLLAIFTVVIVAEIVVTYICKKNYLRLAH